MPVLRVAVQNKIASYNARDGFIVCGNSDYTVQFTFDDEWAAYPKKTARFVWAGVYIDFDFEGDTCQVPPIYNTDSVQVGLYTDGGLHTTTPAAIPCALSILDLGGVQHEDRDVIHADVAQQAAAAAEKSRDEIETWLAEGKLGPTYPIVHSSETIIPTVDGKYYFLQPEVYYVFGEVDALPLILRVPSDKKIHEHAFEFTPTEKFTGLEFKESEPSWASVPQFTPGKTCQVSIVRGIGVAASVL